MSVLCFSIGFVSIYSPGGASGVYQVDAAGRCCHSVNYITTMRMNGVHEGAAVGVQLEEQHFDFNAHSCTWLKKPIY